MADEITRALIDDTAGHVEIGDPTRARRQKPWQRWIDAELG